MYERSCLTAGEREERGGGDLPRSMVQDVEEMGHTFSYVFTARLAFKLNFDPSIWDRSKSHELPSSVSLASVNPRTALSAIVLEFCLRDRYFFFFFLSRIRGKVKCYSSIKNVYTCPSCNILLDSSTFFRGHVQLRGIYLQRHIPTNLRNFLKANCDL